MGDFLFATYSNHQNNSSKKVYLVVAEDVFSEEK